MVFNKESKYFAQFCFSCFHLLVLGSENSPSVMDSPFTGPRPSGWVSAELSGKCSQACGSHVWGVGEQGGAGARPKNRTTITAAGVGAGPARGLDSVPPQRPAKPALLLQRACDMAWSPRGSAPRWPRRLLRDMRAGAEPSPECLCRATASLGGRETGAPRARTPRPGRRVCTGPQALPPGAQGA